MLVSLNIDFIFTESATKKIKGRNEICGEAVTSENRFVFQPPKNNFTSGSCDKTKMIVDTSDQSGVKKNCCPYCFKLQTKLGRHIVLKHRDEVDVQNLMKLPKGNFSRNFFIESLNMT